MSPQYSLGLTRPEVENDHLSREPSATSRAGSGTSRDSGMREAQKISEPASGGEGAGTAHRAQRRQSHAPRLRGQSVGGLG